MNFADGAAATAIYNGYGHLSGADLVGGVGEWGELVASACRADALGRAHARAGIGRQAKARPQRHPHERAASAAFRTDAGELRARRHPPVAGRTAGLFGQWPRGDRAAEEQKPARSGVAEFADAIAGKPTTHTGRWGLANLEVCTAAIESSRTGKEIELKHQVAVTDDDEDKVGVHVDQNSAFIRQYACQGCGATICPPPTSTS